jgi:hypothetical protein
VCLALLFLPVSLLGQQELHLLLVCRVLLRQGVCCLVLLLLLEAWWCQLWDQVLLGLLVAALLLGWAVEVCLVLLAEDQQQHHLGPPGVCSASLLGLLGALWDLQEA